MAEQTAHIDYVKQDDIIETTLAYIDVHYPKIKLKFGAWLASHAQETAYILKALHVDNDVLQASMLASLTEIFLENNTERNLFAAELSTCIEKHLSNTFSREVINLVTTVCRLNRISYSNAQSIKILDKASHEKLLSITDLNRKTQIEALKSLFLALAGDVKVILILLAQRLQILRYYACHKLVAPRLLAIETLEIFAPLADRLGIGQIKWELEDLAFRFYDQITYRYIAKMLDEKRSERQRYVSTTILRLKQVLQNAEIVAEISGRPKHIYSIWRKMYGKHLTFSELYDVLALRVIVPEVKDCYMVLGLIHNLWQSIPKEFDDYISRPKTNGYQSLHTVVVGSNGRTFEIQIRTATMHQFAEYGVAAHWRYKENAYTGEYSSNHFGYQKIDAIDTRATNAEKEAKTNIDKKSNLTPFVLESINRSTAIDQKNETKSTSNSEEILSNQKNSREKSSKINHALNRNAALQPSSATGSWFKQYVDTQLVYVLTPQAKVITLPNGATPIDFAYHLHTDLGHRCRGARVDGVIVSLNTPLQTGQTVEIIALKQGGPSRDWLNSQLGYMQTQRARQKVRAWFNAIDTNNSVATGRTIVEKLLQREGKTALSFDELAARLSFNYASELFLAVAKEEISNRVVEQAITQIDHTDKLTPIEKPFSFHTPYKVKKNSNRLLQGNQVLVAGVDALSTQFAKCCCPAPPDKIVGYLTKTKGVSAHRAQCPNFTRLSKFSPERTIEVDWVATFRNNQNTPLYPVKLHISAIDRPSLMRDIVEVFSREKIKIISIQSQVKKGLMRVNLTVEITATEVIHRTLVWLKEVSGVRLANRVGDS